jgi:hypothetical protein
MVGGEVKFFGMYIPYGSFATSDLVRMYVGNIRLEEVPAQWSASTLTLDMVTTYQYSSSQNRVFTSITTEIPEGGVAGTYIKYDQVHTKEDYRFGVTPFYAKEYYEELLASGKKYKVTLSKPEGVRALSKQIANIEVGFGEAKQMTFNVSGIMIKNLSDGLVANLVSSSDSNVEVKAIGTEDILSNLDTSTIKAYVDLQSMDVGTHEVQVEVESNDNRIQFIVTKRVDIVITKK